MLCAVCCTFYELAKHVVDLFAVPPKPAHLQSPRRAEQAKAHSPTTGKLSPQRDNGKEQDQSPKRGYRVSVSHVSPAENHPGSPSLVRGGGNSFLNGACGARASPARHQQGIPNLTGSPVYGSPSPGKSAREGGHSSAKLSPRNQSPLAGKLRTPSPVQGRMGSYSPAKKSRSWLGLHKIPSGKLEEKEKSAGKSLSLPDLVVYLDESRLDC